MVTTQPAVASAERFDRFWSVYPRKQGKDEARKAWNKLKPSDTLVTTILAIIEAFKQTEDWKKDKGQYVPHPATWLNGKRWEDELPQGTMAESRSREIV